MLAGVGATVELAVLELTVTNLIHDLLQESALVALDQRVPLAPPNHLDNVPAGAPKNPLQLLDDFAVTAHRAVQSLQVAVDHKVQVAQPLAASKRNRAQRLGLITFAVSEETPDLAVSVIHQTALALILHHVGLIDGLNRSQPHRHGGELPVVGHEPRVRIRREASPPNFPTEIFQLLLADHPLEKRARIHARRTVPLVIHQITGMAVGRAAKEMIHPHVIERGARGKTRNMPAKSVLVVVCAHHHRHGIPADKRAYAALHKQIPGHGSLVLRGDRVAKRGGNGAGQRHPGRLCVLRQLPQQLPGGLRTVGAEHRVQRFGPLLYLNSI